VRTLVNYQSNMVTEAHDGKTLPQREVKSYEASGRNAAVGI